MGGIPGVLSMSKTRRSNLGQTAAIVRAGGDEPAAEPAEFRRQLVADLCKLLGSKLPIQRAIESPADRSAEPLAKSESPSAPLDTPPMAPRLRQTLELLLAGDSEKQIARKLAISPHTVHAYVKSLYRKFNVSSRGELLARWVRR